MGLERASRFPLVTLQQARPGAGLGAGVILTTGEARKGHPLPTRSGWPFDFAKFQENNGRRRWLPLFDVGDDEAEQRVEFAVSPGGLITCFAGFGGFLRLLFLRRGPPLGNWHPVLGVGHCIRDMRRAVVRRIVGEKRRNGGAHGLVVIVVPRRAVTSRKGPLPLRP